VMGEGESRIDPIVKTVKKTRFIHNNYKFPLVTPCEGGGGEEGLKTESGDTW
jgi:hypothetical protein